MSDFRERMRVEVSNAELKVAAELQKQKVHGWVKDERIVLSSTVPDFWFPMKRVAVYLDGDKVHRSEVKRNKDELIDEKLEGWGIKVLRYRYHAPLTTTALTEFMELLKVKLE